MKLTVVLLTSDGKRHEKTLDEARELRQGSRYTLDVIATDIDLSLIHIYHPGRAGGLRLPAGPPLDAYGKLRQVMVEKKGKSKP